MPNKKKKRASGSRRAGTKKKSINLAKVTLGLLVLVIIGYAGLAIYEGRIIPEGLEFEMDFFNDDEEEVSDSPKNKTEKKETVPAFDDAKFDLYFTKAFDFMWPAYAVDQQVIERPYYTIRYGGKVKQSLWLAYKINSDSLQLPQYRFQQNLKKDPRVKSGVTSPSDFRKTKSETGLLAPPQHFAYSEFALEQLNYTSLFSPFAADFEAGAWSLLNDQMISWGSQNGEVHVVRGPIFDQNPKRNQAGIAIPRAIFTIVLDMRRPQLKGIGFILPNGKNELPLSNYAVSIDEIEQQTGLDFFPTISAELQNHLEKYIDLSAWF